MGLVESILAMALLSLLFLATAMVLRQTFLALHKVESEASLSQQFQVVASRLSQDIMASCEPGVSLQANALALLTPERLHQPPTTSGLQAHLVWQAHKVYYLETATGQLRLREIALAPPDANPITLTPIPTTGGQILARGVTQFGIEQEGGHLRIQLEGRQRRYGGEERVVHQFAARTRN